jgi:hypothetical protein
MNKRTYRIEGNNANVAVLLKTTSRERVRERVLAAAIDVRNAEGATVTVSLDGRILSQYRFEAGAWVKASGADVRGLAGCDAAAVYMLAYTHVTPEWAASQTKGFQTYSRAVRFQAYSL